MFQIIINGFIWDLDNTQHIAKHSVAPQEADEVIQNPAVIAKTYLKRFIILGITDARRYLAVVIEQRDNDMYYVISARDMSKKEKAFYLQEQEKVN